MTDWNTPSEPEPPADEAPAPEAPPSSMPLRFGEGGEASDAIPFPSGAASGESTTAEQAEPTPPVFESSIPVRYHEGSELGVDPQLAGEPPLGEAPTPAWVDPPMVEPAPVADEPIVERDEPEEIDVPASEDVDEVIAEADDEDDEIVFDLASLSTEERRHLSMRLTGAGISHIWEVATDLVVSVTDAPAIERYIEEVRNPDGFGDEEMASFEEDSDVDDEEVYAAMSNLYVAADKLMQKPGDDATAGEFYVAVDDVDGLPAPFGFDPRVWSQVQDLANKIADTLDAEGDTEVIGTDARTLRQLLANYV